MSLMEGGDIDLEKERKPREILGNKEIWQHTGRRRGRRKSRELPISLALNAWKAAGGDGALGRG